MEAKKRERSANFNTSEVKLLISLVENYKDIIENKRTDSLTNKEKDSAWKEIESSFNSRGITPIVRSWKTLKLKYEGMKKNSKKISATQREMYGGDPATVPEEELSICPDIISVEDHQDSDSIAGAARLELLQLQIETARKELQYMEEKHKLQMRHLAINEGRKQEIHELLVERIIRGHVDGMV